jgi:hypothetical protein
VPKSGEFYTFDEVLGRLKIDANKLKRLVSEGEIRAFREGDEMKFKRGDIDGLDVGKGGEPETLDFAAAEAESSETLTDDLIFDEGDELELDTDEGMATAEITSQDTFVEEEPIGMSTEPLDFSPDDEIEEIEELEEAAPRRAPPRRFAAPVEEKESVLWPIVLCLGGIALLLAVFVWVSIIQDEANGLTRGLGNWFAETFAGLKDTAK